MQCVNIEKRVCLNSKYLTTNIMKHLLDKISESSLDNCSKEYGYILNIKKINNIISHEIGRANTDNIFNINFEVEIFKPEKDLEVVGTICMMFKDGIFIDIFNKQKMLIPVSTLSNYTFDNNIYSDKNGKQLNINDNINAIITAVMFTNKKYSCFGRIV